jgi:hypothetical protein
MPIQKAKESLIKFTHRERKDTHAPMANVHRGLCYPHIMRIRLNSPFRTFASLAAFVACHPASGSSTASASSSSQPGPSLKTTLRPEVAALASELALAKKVESALVGEAGEGSPVYQTFTRLKTAASPAELHALARHESPIVRAYVGEELAMQDKNAPEVQVLLRDQTFIETRSGCKLHTQTIAAFVSAAMAAKPAQ